MLEVKCGRCGKVFIPTYDYAYKDGKRMYCSWTCYNHRNDGKPKRIRSVRAVGRYTLDGEKIADYPSALNASMETGFDACKIRDACCRGKSYNGYLWKYER